MSTSIKASAKLLNSKGCCPTGRKRFRTPPCRVIQVYIEIVYSYLSGIRLLMLAMFWSPWCWSVIGGGSCAVFFHHTGQGPALLSDGAWPAGLPGTHHAHPDHTEGHAHPRGAHDQPAVPRPEPEAHRGAPAVPLLARAVSAAFNSIQENTMGPHR